MTPLPRPPVEPPQSVWSPPTRTAGLQSVESQRAQSPEIQGCQDIADLQPVGHMRHHGSIATGYNRLIPYQPVGQVGSVGLQPVGKQRATPSESDSLQAVRVAAELLRETISLVGSLGALVSWIDESALLLHWRRITGRARSAMTPFGRILVAVGAAAPCGSQDDPQALSKPPSYLVMNHAVLEQATLHDLQPIYEVVAAAQLGMRHVLQATQSQHLHLSQVVVLECGGRFYLDGSQ